MAVRYLARIYSPNGEFGRMPRLPQCTMLLAIPIETKGQLEAPQLITMIHMITIKLYFL